MKLFLQAMKLVPWALKFVSTAGGVGKGGGTYAVGGAAVIFGILGLLQAVAPILVGGAIGIPEVWAIIDIVLNTPEYTGAVLGGLGIGRLRQGVENGTPAPSSMADSILNDEG